MKRNKALVDERRNQILEAIKQDESLSVEALAHQFNVSPLTIRRDLQYWEEKKCLQRFYGGAAFCMDLNKTDEEQALMNERQLIGKVAASFVEDHDVIFINTSSTALGMIPYIKNKHVTIITNNGKAINIDHDLNVNIVLSGGEIRIPKESLVGDFAINNISRMSAKKSFLGCSGLSSLSGMTTQNLQEVAINELMMNRVSQKVFILADHTKIGNESAFISGTLDKIHTLITSNKANQDELNTFEAMNIQVVALTSDKKMVHK